MNPLKFALRTCLTLAVSAGTLFGQSLIPQGLNYQGFLADTAGAPIGQGSATTRSIEFRLYTTATGGSPIWGESQQVSVFNGNFSVILGNGASLDAALSSGLADLTGIFSTPPSTELFFGITEAGQAEFTPRQQILASAFSFRSLQAESALNALNALRADSAGTAEALSAGNIVGTPQIARLSPLGLELGATTTDSVSLTAATNGVLEIRDSNTTDPLVSISSGGLSTDNISATGSVSAGSVSAGSVSAGSVSAGSFSTTGNAGFIQLNGQFNNGAGVSDRTTITPTQTTYTDVNGGTINYNPVPWLGYIDIRFRFFGDDQTLRLSGSGTVLTSDRTLKKDILDLTYSKKDFMKIRPVSFRYLGEPTESSQTLGFIAQEIQELYPEMISTFENGKLGLNQNMMTSVNVAATQAQQQEIDLLKKELSASEERSDKLEDRLKVLEALLLKEQ